jgi:hypothetical protein
MSDMFCIFQKLWNSFDLNESGHVSLSETQRVSSELRIQTSDFTAQIQIQSPEKSEGAQSLQGLATQKEHKVYSEKITS